MHYQDNLDTAELKKYADALNHRAKARNAPGRITVELLRSRILESAGKCEWCNAGIVNQEFEIDHIISLSKYGHNTVDNLAVACPSCNRRKSEKHPASFAQEIAAQHGTQTPLIKRVLAHFGMEIQTQTRFFALEDAPLNAETSPLSPGTADTDTDTPPPYQW